MQDELEAAPDLPTGSRPACLPDQTPDNTRPLPDALRNWQVLDIDGQATPVPAREADGDRAMTECQVADRQDDIIVVAVDVRHRLVEAGAPAAFAVTILNNGAKLATFSVQVEGWIDARWAGDSLPTAQIEPGARATIRLEFVPPRQPETEAGDYHLGFAVRTAAYPDRVARLGAVLTVLPFDALELAFADAPEATVSWLRRTAVLPLTVSNRGNRPVTIHLQGADPLRACTFDFGLPAAPTGEAALFLRPNRGITTPVRIIAHRLPLIGLHGRSLPLQVTARLADAPLIRRARTRLMAQPMVGPWHMVTAAGMLLAGVLGLSLLVVVAVLLMQRGYPTPAVTVPAAPAAAPPVIIVNLNQPAGPSPSSSNAGQSAGASSSAASAAPNPALPLVLPDQVTTPGSGGAFRANPLTDVRGADGALTDVRGAEEQAGAGTLTYAEMFKEIGQRYDIDWKMLAALAYVESGFDSLALSDAGAMGLMQILPDTWREWAPAAAVSDPFDSYSNVLVAAIYLDHVRSALADKNFTGKEWMLVAYNWGPDRLADFLAANGSWETLPEQRRQYVTEILRITQSIP